jgi:hypothetical protein
VHFVDEQYDVTFGLLDLIQHTLQPLFKLTAIFRAGNQGAHVERQEFAAFQAVWHVTIGNAQRQSFGNGRFTNAGFADEDRVVLRAPRKNLDGAADFFITADDRIKLARAGDLSQVAREFLQCIITVLRASGVGGSSTPQRINRGV